MRGRVIVILIAGVVVLGAGAALVLMSKPRPAPIAPAPVTSSPAPTPTSARAPTPPPAAATPEPTARKRVTPARGPAAPSPTPVEATPTTGTLRIESDVPDTSVFLDRVFLGTAPVTASNLAPGPHKLNMSVEGYDAISETIEVAAGSHDVSVKFRELKLDAKLAVVHKHAMRSCTGTLVATPQGMRYDTTDKNDGFTAALTDLEIFEVDYLKKNLRLKVRNGKTYNFTDPDGNADRLFVFQRDVNTVRQRLLAADR